VKSKRGIYKHAAVETIGLYGVGLYWLNNEVESSSPISSLKSVRVMVRVMTDGHVKWSGQVEWSNQSLVDRNPNGHENGRVRLLNGQTKFRLTETKLVG